MQRLSPAYLLKAAELGGQGEFHGYASTFGGPADAYGDIIAPGAFKDSLRVHADRGTMPAMLWAHDQTEPIGRWLSLREDSKGLEVVGKLTLASRRGAEAHALMKDGALAGLSIGYTIPSGGAECATGECLLKRVDLHEISPVALPANARAVISGVKSCDCGSVPELQLFLQRALGVPRSKAREMAFACSRILNAADDDAAAPDAAVRAVLMQFKSLSQLYSEDRI